LKLLKLQLTSSEGEPFEVSLSPNYNEVRLPAHISPATFFSSIVESFFPDEYSNGSLTMRVEFESFQNKYATGKGSREAVTSALSISLIKAEEILSTVLTCVLGGIAEKGPSNVSQAKPTKRLQELRSEMESYYKVEELSRNLDEIHSEIFETQEKLRRFKGPLQEKKRLESEYSEYKALDRISITEQVVGMLGKYDRSNDRYKEEIFELEQEIEQRSIEIDMFPYKPWFLQNEAMIGVALSVLGFISTTFARGNVWMFYAALLLTVLPLGALIYAVIKSNRQELDLKSMKQQCRDLEQKKNNLTKKMELENLPVQKIFETLGVDDCKEVLDMISKKKELAAELKVVEAEIEKLSKGISSQQLAQNLEKMEAASSKIEKELSAFPPMTSDFHSLQIEIENLERAAGLDTTSVLNISKKSRLASVDDLLRLTAIAVGVGEEKLFPVLLKGIEKNISSITKGLVVGMLRAEHEWQFQTGSKFLPLEEFPELQQQAIVFSVQFTIWQMLSHRFPIFFLVDATSITHEGMKQMVVNAAKHIAQRAQIIIVR